MAQWARLSRVQPWIVSKSGLHLKTRLGWLELSERSKAAPPEPIKQRSNHFNEVFLRAREAQGFDQVRIQSGCAAIKQTSSSAAELGLPRVRLVASFSAADWRIGSALFSFRWAPNIADVDIFYRLLGHPTVASSNLTIAGFLYDKLREKSNNIGIVAARLQRSHV